MKREGAETRRHRAVSMYGGRTEERRARGKGIRKETGDRKKPFKSRGV